ncbi:alpha/beta-hydrolase [Cristinia sonorae]|uniref:Carboxylic ester hydrolase n=1 Tax=Cristinia sonorae TaxID=1940300 RepID=A0A8K0USJ4_9AGAR|nr:alpha/beta-hydrolase [Cristinia sonorae]
MINGFFTMTLWVTKTATYCLLYGGFLALSSLSSAPKTIVDLGYAQYKGNLTFPNAVAFLGLPFAEPPVGNRRWRKPLPLDTARIRAEFHGKVVDATTYPDFCVQGTTGGGDAGGAGTEDCLNVNVYAPATAKPGDKLPVLVYIHGGGYTFGNPRNWPFDHWVHQSPNVVIVSVYYRLDSFGFLAHPDFLADHSLGDLNVGFEDQTEALRWVQKNIHAFGGDPSRVTINGESAGGSSIELHLVAEGQKGLFHAAIAQSVYRTPLPSPTQQVPLFNFFSKQAGCGVGTVSSQMACLRRASVSALARAQDAPFNGSYNAFHPVVDGKVITGLPTASLLKGDFQRVPLLVGACSNETLSGGPIESSLPKFFPGLTVEDIAEYEKQYPVSDFDSATQQQQVATGESELICAREIMGGAFAEKTKAYTYRYNQPNPTSGSPAVGHAAENWMMFLGSNTGFNGTTTFTKMTPTESAFAEELIAYWLSFVRAGDPNTHKLARSPSWPEYTAAKKTRLVLQQGTPDASGSVLESEPDRETERCAFVLSKVLKQQN